MVDLVTLVLHEVVVDQIISTYDDIERLRHYDLYHIDTILRGQESNKRGYMNQIHFNIQSANLQGFEPPTFSVRNNGHIIII